MSDTGVGMPTHLKLEHFGRLIFDAFGSRPYLVGSVLKTKNYRDVDVRLILDDTEFTAMFGQHHNFLNPKLAAFTLAFSLLGREMTGLPIDFQIQSMTYANKAYPGRREPLGKEIREEGVTA